MVYSMVYNEVLGSIPDNHVTVVTAFTIIVTITVTITSPQDHNLP